MAHDHHHHDHDECEEHCECEERGCGCGCEHEEGEEKTLIIGGILYVLGLLLHHFVGGIWADGVLLAAYLVTGWEVLKTAGENILHGEVFDECFLMSVSTLGALLLREFPEAVAVMFFYRLGELLEDRAVDKSERSIEELLDIRPDEASVWREGQWETVPCEDVRIGERMLVKPGERIALDGIVLEGSSQLDTRALTGESVPRSAGVGDKALSGCINMSGTLTLEVCSSYGESTAARVIELVREASENKAPSEHFIHRFAEKYTPAVVIMAVALAVLPPLFGLGAWTLWLRRSFVFLVISCPCALVISVPLSFLGGIGAASRKGILCKGSNYLEALTDLDTVVFDKTGTLTEGVFALQKAFCAEGVSERELLECAAAAESGSNHPIALSVLAAYGEEIDPALLGEAAEYTGRGVGVRYREAEILAGNEKLMAERGIAFAPCAEAGTRVYVSRDGRYLGCLLIADRLKSDAPEALRSLRAVGVKRLCLLSGDSSSIVQSVGKELGLDEIRGELLPADKLRELEALLADSGRKLAYVGDGINDAPVLARADVGIAMGALGSDAAIEAADVVLMTDELSKLGEAIAVAKKTKRIVRQNIGFALGVKIAFLLLGALGIAGMAMAILGDVGVMILCVLNAMRMLKQ